MNQSVGFNEIGITIVILGIAGFYWFSKSKYNSPKKEVKMDEIDDNINDISNTQQFSAPVKKSQKNEEKSEEDSNEESNHIKTVFSPYLNPRFKINDKSDLDQSIDHMNIDYWGTTWKMYVQKHNNRSYIFHSPAKRGEEIKVALPLLIYLHGAQGNAWKSAMEETAFRKRARTVGFYVAYPQGIRFSSSTLPSSSLMGKLCKVNHGLTWRYDSEGFEKDKSFIEDIVEDISKHYLIDKEKVFISGYCDGGMLACAMAVKSKIPTAVCSMWGGLEEITTIAKPSSSDSRKIPVLMISGSKDHHAKASKYSHTLFDEAGYQSKTIILPESQYHEYNQVVEPAVLTFFNLK